jgi:hypothetical protein
MENGLDEVEWDENKVGETGVEFFGICNLAIQVVGRGVKVRPLPAA